MGLEKALSIGWYRFIQHFLKILIKQGNVRFKILLFLLKGIVKWEYYGQ